MKHGTINPPQRLQVPACIALLCPELFTELISLPSGSAIDRCMGAICINAASEPAYWGITQNARWLFPVDHRRQGRAGYGLVKSSVLGRCRSSFGEAKRATALASGTCRSEIREYS